MRKLVNYIGLGKEEILLDWNEIAELYGNTLNFYSVVDLMDIKFLTYKVLSP